MESKETKSSSENPLTYLDQNVYDRIRRGHSFPANFGDNFDVVYSSQTLEEIDRSGDLKETYLSILESLKPVFLAPALDDNFRTTDRADTLRGPVKVIFERWKENKAASSGLPESMKKLAHKFFGGQKHFTFDELITEQRNDFSGLMAGVTQSVDEENRAAITPKIVELTEKFHRNSGEMQNTLKSQLNFSGPKDFRETLKVSPKELNNISHPNVIKKIWDSLAQKPEIKGSSIALEQFFNVGSNPMYPGEPYATYDKVIAMYHVLNSIGYYQDRDIEADNRFTSAMNDSIHAANAIFCPILITYDKHFSKKCTAIYEYLNIGTKVFPQF